MGLDSLISDTRSVNRQESEKKDMISKLPEVIIQQVLSLLPMRDAVRTSILSKQWENVWASLPYLAFHLYSEEDKDFIDRALLLRETRVQKFSLVCSAKFFDDAHLLERWITALVRRNVEDLHLGFANWKSLFSFELFYSLLASSSLTRLSLAMLLDFKFPSSVNLSSLKHLVLEFVTFNDAESVDNLFTGCPMLETTRFLGSRFRCNIRISSPKLYKLEITECADWEPYRYCVTISGSSLKSFHLKGMFVFSYSLHDLPCLDEAMISVDNYSRSGGERFLGCLVKLLNGISHVKKLSFSCGAIEALNYERNLLPEVPLFDNLSFLSFDHRNAIELDDNIGLLMVLQNSPCLETLRFEGGVIFSACCNKQKRILRLLPPCFLSCLKRLEILFDNNYENKKLFKNAAKILLKKAFVLEKLIVYLPNQYAGKYIPVHPMDREKLIKSLTELPRTSEVCKIEFVDSEMKSI